MSLPEKMKTPLPQTFWVPEKPSALTNYKSSSTIPKETDVVIVGSGFSGASVAYHLLNDSQGQAKRVVMLEARTVCSGATARNGGHLAPNLLSSDLGDFERLNFNKLTSLIDENDISRAKPGRENQGWLLYRSKAEFEEAKLKVSQLQNRDGLKVYSGLEAQSRVAVPGPIAGAIAHPAQPINTYELVIWLLAQSLVMGLYLYTNTPVTSYQATSGGYMVTTSNNDKIFTKDIIIATNGYTNYLMKNNSGLRTTIYPVRGQVAAFRHEQSPSDRRSNLNWADEYCVVLPEHLVYGGARRYGPDAQVGYSDDTQIDATVSETLDEFVHSRVSDSDDLEKTKEWTGIMGFTGDGQPMVGQANVSSDDGRVLVIAGFNGHGVPRIFMSANALVEKYYGEAQEWPEWFPSVYIN